MHCWKDSSGLLFISMPSKRVPLMIPLCLGKNYPEQNLVNREVVPIQRYSSQTGITRCSGSCEQVHCRGEAAMICAATTLISSRAMMEAYSAGSPNRFADWSSGFVTRTRRKLFLLHRRMGLTWLWLLILSSFLQPRRRRRLPLTNLKFGFQVELKRPCLITSNFNKVSLV